MYIRTTPALLSLLLVIVGVISGSWRIVVLAHIALALLVLVDAGLAPRPNQITWKREAPRTVRVGERADISLTFTNTGRRAIRGAIRDAWPPSGNVAPEAWTATLGVGESATVSETLQPRRRGVLRSEHITIRSAGPLRLGGRQRTFPTEWDLSVLPPFTARKYLPSRVARLRELEGRALLLTRGAGTEFDSLREYVPGDDVRSIDWRSTARTGEAVVRTWRPTRDRQVVIMLDSGRGGAVRINDAPVFDAAIETALLMAALTTKAGDRTDVIAVDEQVRTKLVKTTSSRIMHEAAMQLAFVEPRLISTDWLAAQRTLASIATSPALLILVTTFSIASISEGLLDFLASASRRHQVILAHPIPSHPSKQGEGEALESSSSTGTMPVRNPAAVDGADASVSEVFAQASWERQQLERSALIGAAERLGVHVVTASAEQLPAKVADTYIDLKATGRL
ncbi:MAG: DUF58 domain-containing protein [Actinomycetaceae bacterium]|nr:DUF58 domain-containing protein [Arcanobacterium sp.]MDD7505166.1 DUF58 domain-containing protein [Actinomycetaceae bacterium]